MAKQSQKVNETKKVNSELFSMTYGALVMQLLEDFESDEEVNNQLEKIGYNIGLRIVDDFLSKTTAGRCFDLRETSAQIVKGLKMYLGVTATIANWSATEDEFSIIFDANPITEFVELPQDKYSNLQYSQVLCGAIRGALEMVHLECGVTFVRDQLRDGTENEIRVNFVRRVEEQSPPMAD